MKNKTKAILIFFFGIYLNLILCSCTTGNARLLDGTATEIMKEVRNQVDFPAMNEINSYGVNGSDILKNYYGIEKTNAINDYSLLIPREDEYTEVAIFKLNNKENYDTVLNAIQKRYTDLYNACKAYNPEKINKLKNRTLIRYDNAVVFFINGENENKIILKIIDNFSKIKI